MSGGAKAIDTGADFVAFDQSPPARPHVALPPTSTPIAKPSLPATPSRSTKDNESTATRQPMSKHAALRMQASRTRLQNQSEAGPSRLRDSNYTSDATPLPVATPVSSSSAADGPPGSVTPRNGIQGKPGSAAAAAEVSRKERFQKKKGKNKADPHSSSDAKGGKLSNAEKAAKKALKLERKKAAEEKRIQKNGAAPVNRNGGERTGPKNLQEQRRAASRAAPWVDMTRMARCDNPGQMLNEEVSAFYQFVSPTREEFEVRLYLIELITRAIHKLWPDAIVTPFGSWQTQLYLPSGDIDLVVEHHNVGATKSSRALHLGALGRALREANITDTVAVIANAKVPIIKFVTLDGRINVDISLNQTNGIASGKIINQYLDVIPGSRQLIMVVKSFLSQRSMNEVFTGGLGSYAVICMVISFLQIHPQLRSSQINAEKNLGTLLVEFFELYGRNFNYDHVGLSIRRGGFYFDKRARGWLNDAKPFLLSVEDPQDPDSDIGGGSFGVRTVRGAMAGAFELLTGRMFERSTQMAEIHAARGNNDMLDDLSILSAVMGFSPDMVRKRQALTALHQEGRLQRMLRLPFNANLSEHLTHYLDPMQVGGKRSRPPSPAPPSKKQKGDSMIQAIVVDDDSDAEDFLDSSSDDASQSDDDDERQNSQEDEEEEEDGHDLLSNGEAEVVYPNGNGVKRQDRFASVSEDGEIHETHEVGNDDDEDSRYAVSSRTKSQLQGSTSDALAVVESVLDDLSQSSSDDDKPIPAPSRTRASSSGKSQNQLSKSEKRAFWAAKAGRDDFGDGDDFVSFD